MQRAVSLVAGLLLVLSLVGCNNRCEDCSSRYDDCSKAATALCTVGVTDPRVLDWSVPLEDVKGRALLLKVELCIVNKTFSCVNEKK